MPVNINLDHLNLSFKLAELSIQVEQISYGVFNVPCPRHHHSLHFYEVHLVCDGKGKLVTNDNEYHLSKGNLYMTGPNIDHEQLTDSQFPMTEYCLGMEIKKGKKNKLTDFSNALLDTTFWFGNDHNDRCYHLFNELEQESLHRNIGCSYNVQSMITCILVELVRNYSNHTFYPDPTTTSLDHKRSLIIDNCFLTQYNTITETELCQILGLSTRQLQRFLKNNYGKTFREMRQIARLNKAHELLSLGNDIETTALLVGYEDIAYFKKLLKK